MSQEQPQRPMTYKDVFGDAVQGEVAAQPVTIEDASLMQSAEAFGLGKTPRGGAASLMQSAADKNVRDDIVDPVSHSDAAERGFGLRETIVDGKVYRQEFVGQQPVSEETTFVPTLSEIAATQGITIGEALEEAALNNPNKIVDKQTARAIQSAEARATGIPLGFKGGLGASAQSAAQKNADRGEHITLSEVLDDATERMLVDKVVTKEDVQKVKHVVAGDENSVIVSALEGAVDANTNADRYIEAQQGRGETLPSPPTHEPTLGEALPQDGPQHAHVD
ncbi:hypothetical protein GOP47_0029757 [Adiantum capillus-veneris]|nr:hypothetical protein GOP47_0029757 [Adiantum capillus-veneris]